MINIWMLDVVLLKCKRGDVGITAVRFEDLLQNSECIRQQSFPYSFKSDGNFRLQ